MAFLERLILQLEEHFLSFNVQGKLDKRKGELAELKSIVADFSAKLGDMREHLNSDLQKVMERRASHQQLQQQSVTGSLLDEMGNPVDLIGELAQVQGELEAIMGEVNAMEARNEEIRASRQQAEDEFFRQELLTLEGGVFDMLKVNGATKRKIIGLIKQLKEVSKKIKDTKSQYQQVRGKLESYSKPRKLYKAVVGDLVDELFADYINRLGCPVPVKRTGQNNYLFGTKKVSAKIINGRLVIRVGGGYMGIEEFMMYYGQQELQKILKEEQAASIIITDDLESMQNDADISRVMRKNSLVDVDKLQKQIRDH